MGDYQSEGGTRKLRSGKSLGALPVTGIPNVIDTDAHIVTEASFSNSVCNLSPHRTPKVSEAGSVRSNNRSDHCSRRDRQKKEILKAEIAIKMKELEIQQQLLVKKKQELEEETSSEDELRADEKEDKSPARRRELDEYRTCVTKSYQEQGSENFGQTGNRTRAGEFVAKRVDHFTSVGSGLPKIEIDKFDGNPMKFWKFLKTFEMSVSDRLWDENQRLIYLLHYCTGDAKEAIEHCVFLPEEKGYSKAMEILKTQFGRPHDIAERFLSELLVNQPIGPGDTDSLRKLVRQMTSCELALSQMNYTADLNCTTNLKRIVARLPRHLQQRWAELADDTLQEGAEPSFRQLISFLEKRLSISSNCYGQAANPSRKLPTGRSTEWARVNSLLASDFRCQECSEGHSLTECPKFKAKNCAERFLRVRESKMCFNCLRPNHRASECRSPPQCTWEGCSRRHHSMLHASRATPSDVNVTQTNRLSTFLAFVPVRVTGPLGSKEVYALLDTGSDSTLILSDVATSLGLSGKSLQLEVTSLNGTSLRRTEAINCCIHSLHEDSVINIERVYTVDSLPISHARVPSETLMQEWRHLDQVKLHRIPDLKVAMLIGADVSEAHWVIDKRIGTRSQPHAYQTVLGWVVLGPHNGRLKERMIVNCATTEASSRSEMVQVFDLDFRNENSDLDRSMSVEDKQVLALAQQTIELVNGHYQLRLPWKVNWRQTPESRTTSERRLSGLRRRLSQNESLRQQYTEILASYEAKGYVRKVRDDRSVIRRFVPHHPVLNPQKPNKVRIVFDCAAKSYGTSLNDCLYSGPDMTNDLTGVLLRFRINPVVLVADVEEMFLQVRLIPADRASLSFLWHPNGQLDTKPEVYELNVHPFGATSSPFNANFALQQVAIDNAGNFDAKTIEVLRNNFYVDDCLASVETVEEAVRLAKQLSVMLSLGGFRLHKWVSNRPQVLSAIPAAESDSRLVQLGPTNTLLQKTLGLFWCRESDSFRFKFDLPTRPATKRGILSCIASLYDPLGFVAPLLLQPKRLLQELCRTNRGWDEPVDPPIAAAWESWTLAIRQTEAVRVPRCVRPTDFAVTTLQLHLFSDASEIGYGAVAYLRGESSDGSAFCSFLLGKSRVAPLKTVTIPRLELQAAVLSVKLMCYITRETKFRFEAIHLWTDSCIVLNYISNSRTRFKTYVANRVSFIRDNTDTSQWKFVPTGQNPADLASRGMATRNIQNISQWLQGPQFLLQGDTSWPQLADTCVSVDLPVSELKKTAVIFNAATTDSPMDRLLAYFSSWTKIRRAVAWYIRFTTFVQARHLSGSGLQPCRGPLKLIEIERAERSVMLYVQSKVFPEFTQRPIYRQGILHIPKAHPLRKLCPIVIDGLLCVGGRLRNSELNPASKHPVILPGSHPVAEAIMRHYHISEGHMGTSHVLAVVRQKYWIVRGTAVAKRVIHKCIACREQSALPVSQIMADLPPSRVIPEFPFAATGVDYFGPFYIRHGRKNLKRYGCLFTCFQTRAVHIEVAHNLTIDSFLMTFARFVNRRGRPREMYSDRGTNFVGAEHELRQCRTFLQGEQVVQVMADRDIDWKFNPPYSSHRGGVWERMIRSIRRVLSAVSREQILTEESLCTYLTEVERILNDRPLVPVYDDPYSLDVLTPNHLLRMREQSGTVGGHVDLRARYTRCWRQAQLLADTFWRRWLKEYLPSLQGRGKWITPKRDIQIGDLVLVLHENLPRGDWPRGLVTQVKQGGDGRTRDVSIRTTKGVIERDIRKICLLEGVDDRGDCPL